jgi:hypothetical protein
MLSNVTKNNLLLYYFLLCPLLCVCVCVCVCLFLCVCVFEMMCRFDALKMMVIIFMTEICDIIAPQTKLETLTLTRCDLIFNLQFHSFYILRCIKYNKYIFYV